MPPEREARMLEAMAAWNESMGESVSQEPRPMLVLVGSGHVALDAGILESVRARRAKAQSVVLPFPHDGQSRPLAELLLELRKPENSGLAGFYWLLAL